MSTFVFAPGIKVYIDTHDYGILDVSEDLTRGGMQRRSDGVSQFQFGLNNVRRKYDNVFKPNDRLVVVMKRLTWLRTYTGYLNSVPLFSSWPREVMLTSSCSLKRLQYFFWDPNLAASQNLVRQSLEVQNDGSTPDGGIKQVVINLLEEVVDWSSAQALGKKELAGSKVHIGAIPANWFDYAAVVAQSVADNQKEEAALATALVAYLGAGATIAGQTGSANGKVPEGVYEGVGLDTKQADYASQIISITLGQGLTTKDAAIAIGCCLQESSLRMLANHYLPESLKYPHDGVGGDDLKPGDRGFPSHSVGLFQQQAGTGFSWGTIAECMDVTHSTNKFLGVLKGISNRATLPFTTVVQHVQGSKFPNAYAKWEKPANAIVAAYAPTNNGTLGSALGTPGNPTSGNSTALTPVGHTSTTGTQLVETARLLVPMHVQYLLGGDSAYNDPHPTHLDCSSFVQWVYYHALGDINGMPRTAAEIYAWAIKNGGQAITPANAHKNPGSLCFVGSSPESIDHVEMVVAQDRTIGAHHSGTEVGEISYPASAFDYACTLPKITYVAGAVVPLSGDSTSTGTSTSTITAALATGATAARTDIITGPNAGAIDNLFGPTPWINTAQSGGELEANSLIGIRSLQNDEAILPYINNLLNATMRQFCSAPNGDFIAWFPDYYGLWGTAAKMVLQAIEVKDFQVDWNDEFLITHQFVQPTNYGGQQLDLASGNVQATDVLAATVSAGIATIEQPGIMAALFGLDQTKDETERFTREVLDRFGARPDHVQIPGVTGPKGEFFMALFLFMQNWTHQFTANIEITFMPELFPGMLIQFPDYNFQAYVVQVEHTFTLGEGGGFGTTINIAAPSRIKDTGGSDYLLGLPIAGTKHRPGKTHLPAPAKGGTAKGRSSKAPSAKTGSKANGSKADYEYAARHGVEPYPGIANEGRGYVQGRGGRQGL